MTPGDAAVSGRRHAVAIAPASPACWPPALSDVFSLVTVFESSDGQLTTSVSSPEKDSNPAVSQVGKLGRGRTPSRP